MYSWEIESFLKERNFCVAPEECNQIVNVNNNTQISYVKYSCYNNEYYMRTEDGYEFRFKIRS